MKSDRDLLIDCEELADVNMEADKPILQGGCMLELKSHGECIFQFKTCQAGRAHVADKA